MGMPHLSILVGGALLGGCATFSHGIVAEKISDREAVRSMKPSAGVHPDTIVRGPRFDSSLANSIAPWSMFACGTAAFCS